MLPQNSAVQDAILKLNTAKEQSTVDFSCLNYVPEKGDIFIVSYPRSGQTWMRHILWSMVHNHGDPLPPNGLGLYDVAPWFEHVGKLGAERAPKPRILATHLTLDLLPIGPDAKYILVVRNPKDVQVSWYNFGLMMNWKEQEYSEHFEQFLDGRLLFGSYFEHIKQVVDKIQGGDCRNFLLVLYENLNLNTHAELVRIAKFLEIPAKGDQLDQLVQKTVEGTKIENMKQGQHRFIHKETWENKKGSANFVRSGQIGGWKEVMSGDQSDRIDKRYQEYFEGTMAENWFRDFC